jgi:hypothetical protein
MNKQTLAVGMVFMAVRVKTVTMLPLHYYYLWYYYYSLCLKCFPLHRHRSKVFPKIISSGVRKLRSLVATTTLHLRTIPFLQLVRDEARKHRSTCGHIKIILVFFFLHYTKSRSTFAHVSLICVKIYDSTYRNF